MKRLLNLLVYVVYTPTTGSPTITLFQLRSNCYTVLYPHNLSELIKLTYLDFRKKDVNTEMIRQTALKINQ
jgi:hypothetical protein